MVKGKRKLTTVTVCIGNSDNKLPQAMWADLIRDVFLVVNAISSDIYFQGGTSAESRKQRYSYVFACECRKLAGLRRGLRVVRKHFIQDSIAMVVGDTQYL